MFQNIEQFIRSYHPFEVLVELSIIWIVVYFIFRFLKGTRGGTIFKGASVLIIVLAVLVRVLGQGSDALARLDFIYQRFLALLAILMIVVFQPELRHAMIRLGRARLFGGHRGASDAVIEAISEACEFLSKSQFGALIAIERDTRLGTLIGGGEALDSVVSTRMLESIFWPNSPLHDLGVVVRDDRIVAANVQFPLADDTILPPKFGSRHRAAVGVTLDSDCLVVVVSEETGDLRVAEDGVLSDAIPRDEFREELDRRLNRQRAAEEASAESADGSATEIDPDPRHRYGPEVPPRRRATDPKPTKLAPEKESA